MSLEDLRQAVLAEARAEAERIVREAEAARARVVTTARAEADQDAARALADEEARLDAINARALATEARERALEYVTEKNRILDQVFARAEQALRELPRDEAAALVARGLHQLPEGVSGTVYVPQALAGARIPLRHGLELGGIDPRLEGGFVVRGDSFEIDASHRALLAQLRDELAPELASALFGGRG